MCIRQIVRYYGHYSPAFRGMARGKRKKSEQEKLTPSVLEPDGSSKEYRRNWDRLIQKIYEVDPLACPKCSGAMRVISVIENDEIIYGPPYTISGDQIDFIVDALEHALDAMLGST